MAPHSNKDSSPQYVLTFFREIFYLLVEHTNVYYQQHVDGQAGPSRQLPDIKLPDMTFVALALQRGHELKDTLHDYWSRLKQLHTLFYGETITQDRFLYILHFLHFADNSQRPDKGEEYDRLRKLWTVFNTMNKAYANFYLASGSGQGNCKIKGQGYLKAMHSKEKKMFQHQNLQTLIGHDSVLH